MTETRGPRQRVVAAAVTDAEVRSALTDFDTLLLTLLGEGRGEELEGRVSIGCTVRTRKDDDRWPDDIKGVCLQKLQFSCWQPVGGLANYKYVMEQARLIVADHAVRSTRKTDAIYRETVWVTEGLLNGAIRDRVGGANHYMTRKLWETAPPLWAKGKSPTAFVGHHAFFRL